MHVDTKGKRNAFGIFRSSHTSFLFEFCSHFLYNHESELDKLYTKSEFHNLISDFLNEYRNSDLPEDTLSHYQAYNTLLKYDWIIEFKRDLDILVDISPYAKSIIDFIDNFDSLHKISYGEEVIKVLSLLEYACQNSENVSEAVSGAYKSASLFVSHLKSISSHIHLYEKIFEEENNVNNIIFEFFENYMEKNFIEDFKKIKTSENPFKYRGRIIALCDVVINSDIQDIKVINEAFEIQKIFSSIDVYIDILDKASQRLERKISNTIRFFNEINKIDNELVVNAIRKIVDEPEFGSISQEADFSLPDSPDFLFEERVRNKRKEVTVLKETVKDPAYELRQKMIKDYFERNFISPQTITNFIDDELKSRDSISGSDINIQTLFDFFLFERIRSIAFIERRKFESKWSITIKSNMISNEWISCYDFTIQKKAN